jgi:hypothetical protein
VNEKKKKKVAVVEPTTLCFLVCLSTLGFHVVINMQSCRFFKLPLLLTNTFEEEKTA